MEDHVHVSILSSRRGCKPGKTNPDCGSTIRMATSNILQLVERAAAASPERTALRQGDTRLSYAELVAGVDVMALRLAAAGITATSTFAVLCENCPEILLAYYAAAKLRAVFVPINPALSAVEVGHVIRHSSAAILLHDAELLSVAESAMPDAARRWTFERLATLDVGGGTSSSPATDATDATADFLVIYTSGSTGTPKAVVFDQSAEIGGNASLIEMWGIAASDITLVALPLGFLYGLSTAAATGLQAGGEIVLLRKFHPRDALKALVERRATVFHGVPTMFAMMLNCAETEGLRVDLGGVRLLISAGAPLAEDLRRRFEARFGKRIDDYYALTEARPVFGRRFDDPQVPPRGAIGKAGPGVEVLVVGGNGRVLGVREHGELVVRAPGMFRRYAKAPELTERARGPLGFRTGDIGFYDEQGYFYIAGRIKDIIIRGGANISPAEVENALSSHPDVQLAGVVGAPDSTFGEVVAAFVTLRPGASVTAKELIEHCGRQLAGFKVPASVRVIPTMPLGSTGKIDKNALKLRLLRTAT